MESLIARGMNVRAVDAEYGWTSLHWAVYFGNVAIAGLLLQNGADPAQTDKDGRTASFYATGGPLLHSESPLLSAVSLPIQLFDHLTLRSPDCAAGEEMKQTLAAEYQKPVKE